MLQAFRRALYIVVVYLITYFSSYHEKAINALYELALVYHTKTGESREVPLPTAQQVNLPACSSHYPCNAKRQVWKP